MTPHEGAHRGRPFTRDAAGWPQLLADFVRSAGTVTTSEVAEHFGWTIQRAQRELAALRDEGKLVSHHTKGKASSDWSESDG